MSQTLPTLTDALTGSGADSSRVRAAVARAAAATGVDFDYLLAQARMESGLDPNARASTSSAAGLYQFVGGTWLDTLQRHGAEHGLGWAADAAASASPAVRAQLMSLRKDPETSSMMAAELTADNKAALGATLGRDPDSAELYLAHFLGVDGAGKFLGALQTDPGQSAASLLPKAASTNHAVFFNSDGSPKSVGEVMESIRQRLASAISANSAQPAGGWIAPSSAVETFSGGPVAQAFQQAATAPQQTSMAETLRQTFAPGGDDSTAPDTVRLAYARLSALGF